MESQDLRSARLLPGGIVGLEFGNTPADDEEMMMLRRALKLVPLAMAGMIAASAAASAQGMSGMSGRWVWQPQGMSGMGMTGMGMTGMRGMYGMPGMGMTGMRGMYGMPGMGMTGMGGMAGRWVWQRGM